MIDMALLHNPPKVTYNSGVHNKLDHYTLMLIDPDVPVENSHLYVEFVHWAIVNIPGRWIIICLLL